MPDEAAHNELNLMPVVADPGAGARTLLGLSVCCHALSQSVLTPQSSRPSLISLLTNWLLSLKSSSLLSSFRLPHTRIPGGLISPPFHIKELTSNECPQVIAHFASVWRASYEPLRTTTPLPAAPPQVVKSNASPLPRSLAH